MMAATNDISRVVLSIPNIHCGHCIKTVTREFKQLPSVVSVEASMERKEVAVEYRGDALSEIKATLEEIGYPVAA
jgi:copper chaperone CopZ